MQLFHVMLPYYTVYVTVLDTLFRLVLSPIFSPSLRPSSSLVPSPPILSPNAAPFSSITGLLFYLHLHLHLPVCPAALLSISFFVPPNQPIYPPLPNPPICRLQPPTPLPLSTFHFPLSNSLLATFPTYQFTLSSLSTSSSSSSRSFVRSFVRSFAVGFDYTLCMAPLPRLICVPTIRPTFHPLTRSHAQNQHLSISHFCRHYVANCFLALNFFFSFLPSSLIRIIASIFFSLVKIKNHLITSLTLIIEI